MTVIRTVLIVLILASGLVIFSLLASPRPNTAVCPNCNVIYIVIDTLGAKHTSLYDASLTTTPFLKKIADERGVVFENAYAEAPWTLPSHVSLLTGENPWDVGVWLAPDKLPERVSTLAEIFNDAGWQTTAVSNGGFVRPEWGYEQGFNVFEGSIAEKDWNDLPYTFERGMTLIQKTAETQKRFFLFLHSFHVHDPHGTYGAPGTLDIEDIVAVNTKEGGPTEADAKPLRDKYRVSVREADEALKTLFADLETKGLTDSTVVVVTADHGEEFNEHGTAGFHATALYRESIQVPLVFFIPGVKPQRISASVTLKDIPKTLTEIVGLHSGTAGESLLSLILGKNKDDRVALSATAQEREHVFSVIIDSYRELESFAKQHPPQERREHFAGQYAASAVEGRWHVIKNFDGASELYDMQEDPEEKRNLIQDRSLLPYQDQVIINRLFIVLQSIR